MLAYYANLLNFLVKNVSKSFDQHLQRLTGTLSGAFL